MPCDYFAEKLSNLSFTFGNWTFELMPEAYLMDAGDLDPEYADSCIIGISPIPGDMDDIKIFLFGDTFLRHFYQVYDFENW